MDNTNFSTFYAVFEHRDYEKLLDGTYDIGTFYVEKYSFEKPKELYKEFTDWSKAAIDELVFTSKEEAYKSAITKTIKKLTEVKKRMQIK